MEEVRNPGLERVLGEMFIQKNQTRPLRTYFRSSTAARPSQAPADDPSEIRDTSSLAQRPEWKMILEARKAAFRANPQLLKADTAPNDQREATLDFVSALSERWDEMIMGGDGSWKTRVATSVTQAINSGVEILGTAEWEPELNSLVEAQGLAVSSSHRMRAGKQRDGCAIIFDPQKFELVNSGKHTFSETLGATEKIAHQALLRRKSNDELVFVQSAHLEKMPEDPLRNAFRVNQMKELAENAREASQQGGVTAVLLADSNSEATMGGKENPVDGAIKEVFTVLHRPSDATSVTALRQASIDLIAARPADGSQVGEKTNLKLNRARQDMQHLLPGAESAVLPSAHNPSDHALVMDSIATPSGGCVTGFWNVLAGAYRDPLKGNLFYPMALLFDQTNPEDVSALRNLKDNWANFYGSASEIPSWQSQEGPNEKSFLSEYLIGAPMKKLTEIREAADAVIERWTPSEQQEFEKAREAQPRMFADHPQYKNCGQLLYLIQRDRKQLVSQLRQERPAPKASERNFALSSGGFQLAVALRPPKESPNLR